MVVRNLRISAAPSENRVSVARQEDCLWLNAESEEPVCPSVLFPAALGLHLSEVEGDHTPILP